MDKTLALSDSQETILEKVVVGGDISSLSPDEKVAYYKMRCDAAGLDWRTQPFSYLRLQGKLVLYATKTATEQLCEKRGISVEIVNEGIVEGELYRVHSRAISVSDNRHTDNIGVVDLWNNTKGQRKEGDDLANAMMKAVTKGARRAVLGHCGMGMLDETEVDTIPDAVMVTPSEAHGSPVAQEAEGSEMAAGRELLDEVEALRVKAVELGFKTKANKAPAPLRAATVEGAEKFKRGYQKFIADSPKTDAQQADTSDAVEAEGVMDLDGTDYLDTLDEQYSDIPAFGTFLSEVQARELPWNTNQDAIAFERAYEARTSIPIKCSAMTSLHWAEVASWIKAGDFTW